MTVINEKDEVIHMPLALFQDYVEVLREIQRLHEVRYWMPGKLMCSHCSRENLGPAQIVEWPCETLSIIEQLGKLPNV
mgnify:CR=1 FL=1